MVRRIFLLCGLGLFLWSGIAYTPNAPHAGVVPQDNYPSTPEGWVKLYEDEANRCKKEALEVKVEMEKTRGQVAESLGAPMLVLVYNEVRRDYVKACGDYHHYMRQAAYARSHLPTPTPTPTPSPTPLLPAASPEVRTPRPLPSPPGTGTLPLWPREENDLHVKFITDQKRKLRELKERADKLIKEADDLDIPRRQDPFSSSQPSLGTKTEFDFTSGLSIVKLTTPHGVVQVFLPDDMRAGDTVSISGLVNPAGLTDAERARNQKALENTSLTLQMSAKGSGTLTPIDTIGLTGGRRGREAYPGDVFYLHSRLLDARTDTINLNLKGKDGVVVGSANIRLAPRDQATPQVPDSGLKLPTIVQNNGHLEINYSSDGDAATTQVRVNGQLARVLAESPRKTVVEVPANLTGPVKIELRDKNIDASGACRLLGIRLSAPKTSLLKGETTDVTIEVSGLSGIKHDVPLHLEASGVINMDGGNYQYLDIRPQDVKPDGRYTTTRAITGQQAGGFGVTATVIDPRLRPIIIPLIENGGVNGYRVKKDGTGFVINVENVKHPITGDPVEGEHKLEHKCPDLKNLPYVQNLFLNKGIGKGKSECLILITPRIVIQEEN